MMSAEAGPTHTPLPVGVDVPSDDDPSYSSESGAEEPGDAPHWVERTCLLNRKRVSAEVQAATQRPSRKRQRKRDPQRCDEDRVAKVWQSLVDGTSPCCKSGWCRASTLAVDVMLDCRCFLTARGTWGRDVFIGEAVTSKQKRHRLRVAGVDVCVEAWKKLYGVSNSWSRSVMSPDQDVVLGPGMGRHRRRSITSSRHVRVS